MRILCDVDLTIIETDECWLNWLILNSEYFDAETYCKDLDEEVLDYNLSTYFQGLKGDPYSFWRKDDLYDNLTPLEHSQEVLEKYSDECDLVFVSALKGDHHKSKVNFCKKHFPFMKGFIGTKEKYHVVRNDDILIDDRMSNFYDGDGNPIKCHKILFGCGYSQQDCIGKTEIKDIHYCGDWYEVEKVLKNIIKGE